MRLAFAALVTTAILSPSHAADVFADGANGAKVHEASGFVCPLKIGDFERDAVGERDPETGTDYCAYSALDGVYGSVMLRPAPKEADPKALLDADFAVEEGSGARLLAEWYQPLGAKNAPLQAYLRTYETAHLESQRYITLFASAAVNGWVVQATVEYADPRNKDLQAAFLNVVYAAAAREIGTQPTKPDPRRAGVKKVGFTSLGQYRQ